MTDKQMLVFAKYRNTVFALKEDGILVFSSDSACCSLEKTSEWLRRTKEESSVKRKNSDENTDCLFCRVQREDRYTLFPVCTDARPFVFCQENIKREPFSQTKRKKTRPAYAYGPGCCLSAGTHEAASKKTTAVLLASDFLLATGLEKTNILLKKNTKVLVEKIAMSHVLFFRLLENTVLCVKSRVSVFPHKQNEDCIQKEADGDAGLLITNTEFSQERAGLFLENIQRIPQNSIVCSLRLLSLSNSHFACILSKIKTFKHNEVEKLELSADKEEYVREILKAQDRSIYIGGIKLLCLKKHAVNILPKLDIPENNEMDKLRLSADSEEQIADVLGAEDRGIWIGKVKYMELRNCEVAILPKLRMHTNNRMDMLSLSADNREQIAKVLAVKKESIWIGETKKLYIRKHAVNILPKLGISTANEMDILDLFADNNEQTSELVKEKDSSIWVGRIKCLELRRQEIRILPKLKIPPNNEMDVFGLLYAGMKAHVADVLKTKNRSIWIGKTKKIILDSNAINTLPLLKMHRDNRMETLELSAATKEHTVDVLCEKDGSICMGEVGRLFLENYTAMFLPKFRLDEGNTIETLELSVESKFFIAGLFKEKDRSIWTGRIKNLRLEKHAVEILPKLEIDESTEMESFVLCAYSEYQTTEILKTENKSICVCRKTKKLELVGAAVETILKLRIHKDSEFEELCLSVDNKEHIARLLKETNKSLCIGRTRKLGLSCHAANLLPKLQLSGACKMEELVVFAENKKQIEETLGTKDGSIHIGEIKTLRLDRWAVNILPKLKINAKNTMDSLELSAASMEHISEILSAKNNGIWIGKTKKIKITKYAARILPKLKTVGA
ncbi:MAG: uncharacterized protein A8A55_0814 [Amphiamblys sp. WSBS2006]|nr:MAG: uncharacterized protein A8A55_0814 [Amphiamblys sp. WSBS2006]